MLTNIVYKMGKDCLWSYIGETERCFETRKKEHIRNVQWQSKEVNTVFGKIIMRDYNTVTLLYH